MSDEQTASLSGPVNTGREAFLAERQRGIGGSDAAAIVGASKWKTPLALYLEKRGEAPAQPESPAMRWGTLLEPLVRQQYCNESGESVRVPSLLVHPTYPWMIGHLDGITDSGRVVELKTARSAEGWGEPGTDEIPDAYLVQVQHYMLITALPVADVAVLIGGSDFRRYEVPADRDLHGMLIEQEAEFWARVKEGRPPDPVSLADARLRWPTSSSATVQASPDILRTVERLRAVRDQLGEIEAEEQQLAAEILKAMGEADTLAHRDAVIATWKSSKPTMRFDAKAFQAAHPDLYQQFVHAAEATRRFTLKPATK